MPNQPQVSVLIPAYNEACNIEALLRAVFEQRFAETELLEVIVYSDGSSDKTVTEAKKVHDSRLQIVEGKKRQGVNATENALLEMTKGEAIVFLNADTALGTKDALDRLAKTVLTPGIGIAGARIESLPGRGFFEKVMAFSHSFKRRLAEGSAPDGDSVYLCHGRARALSQELAEKLRFPDQCPEDAYSYFFAKKMGLKFRYVPEARVFFRSPSTLADHLKQSTRFQSGKRVLERSFSRETLRAAYRLPFVTSVKVFFSFFVRSPILLLSYLGILVWIRLTHRGEKEQSRWEISQTSKQLNT